MAHITKQIIPTMKRYIPIVVPAVKRAGLRIPYENEEYYFNEQGQRIVYLKKDKQAITPIVVKDGKVVTQ